LTYSAGTGGSIKRCVSPQTVNYGGSGTSVTAIADTGYHFVNWSDDSTANPRTDTNVTADVDVTANFALNTHKLTIAKAGTGSGTVTPEVGEHNYDYGTVVTLVAEATTGSTFAGWTGDSDCSDGSVTMNANKACTATFNINTYTLTYTAVWAVVFQGIPRRRLITARMERLLWLYPILVITLSIGAIVLQKILAPIRISLQI
jgi:hypothetical protein